MRFEAGQRWIHPTHGVFRVMAVAEGWAFGRYPQCIPFAIRFAELTKEFTLHSPAPRARRVKCGKCGTPICQHMWEALAEITEWALGEEKKA